MGLLTPDPGTLFWMVIIFGIVFFILAKYAFPVITGMVDKRKQYIDSSLEAARQANEQLQPKAKHCWHGHTKSRPPY